MKTLRIFLSSPGDVAAERDLARGVIADLQKRYTGSFLLQAVCWEDLPLSSHASFQEGIDLVLSAEHGIDIAVFILWSRFGSPTGARIRKVDGSRYLSGTEREWDLMLRARAARGDVRPDILTYIRDDQNGFIEAQRGKDFVALRKMVGQQGKLNDFIAKHFTDQKTGANRRAYFTFKEPITFAHLLRTHLRARLNDLLVHADLSAVVWHPAERGSPFRGLEVFEYEHAPLFFGREQEVCDLQIRLRQQAEAGCAFVLLVGASGSGKSSLARAGVAPAVAQYDREDEAAEWRRAVFTPGVNRNDLLLGLIRALATPSALPELADENLAELAEGLARDSELTFRFKLRPLLTGRRRLLLIFDQVEELFTHGEITAEAQRQLGAALGVLARSACVWILATVRSDYYARFQAVPELLALKGEGAHVDLPPPALADLQRIITQPARAAGLRFEENEKGERLDARLLADAAVHPEALPLLEFCLDVLYQRQATRGGDGVLRWTDYEAMRAAADAGQADAASAAFASASGQALESGLAGALVSQAEAALASLPAEHQRQCLSAIFSKLLDLSSALERETPVRRTALEAELLRNPYQRDGDSRQDEELPGARAFLEAFTSRRLLVSGVTTAQAAADGDGQEPPQRTYTVAHEALLRNWWRLRRLQAEQAEFFRIRRQVERAQADWLAAGRDDSFLLAEGLPLQLARKLATDAPELLTGSLADYIAQSSQRVERLRRRRRRLTAVIIAGLTLLAAGAGVGAWLGFSGKLEAQRQAVIAEEKTREVKALLAESDSERAERLFAEDAGAGAVWHLCRAVSSDAPSPRMLERLWFSLKQRSWPIPLIEPAKHSAEVTALTFDPSGERFASATRDGTVSIFSSKDGKSIGAPLNQPKTVRGLRFSPDGMLLLTACDDAVARVWAVGKARVSLLGASKHQDVIAGIAWSGDGKRYATGSWDNRLCVWDPAHPETPVFETQMKAKVHTVAFDPKNSERILGVAKDEACVWDIRARAIVLRYQAPEELNGACFSMDGTKVLSFSADGDIVIAETAGGLQHWAQLSLGAPCHQAAFSPDGEVFAVAFGSRIRVYALQQPPLQLWEHNFTDIVSLIKFTTEGKRLITAGNDGMIQVFDSHGGRRLSEPIVEAGTPVALDFHAAGNRILSARSTRTVRIWGLSLPSPLPVAVFNQGAPPLLLNSDREVECVAANGKAVVFAAPAGPAGSVHARRYDFGVPLSAATVHPDGRIVAGSIDGQIIALEGERSKEIGKLDAPVSQLAFSATGSVIAAGGDNGRVALWRWPEAGAISQSWKHADRISGLAFLEPGTRLVSASWDREIALMEAQPASNPVKQWPVGSEPQVITVDSSRRTALVALNSGEVLLVSPTMQAARVAFTVGSPPSSAALNSDGSMAAVGTVVGTVTIWNNQGRVKIAEISCGDSRINSLCFGMDGRWLGVGTEDGQARVFETASGRPVTEAMPHTSAVRHILFLKNSQYLVTAVRDGLVLVWPLLRSGDTEQAVKISRRVMHDGSGVQRFIPSTETVPESDIPLIRHLIENTRGGATDGMRQEAELLDAYLDPHGG